MDVDLWMYVQYVEDIYEGAMWMWMCVQYA